MAQLAIAAAGAAIGNAAITGTVLGLSGAAIGWMAGSIAGSMLFPPEAQNGPRIEDLKVTAGTYGEMIPMAWGTVRVPANVIWSSDLIEHSEEVGGKGFGGEGGKMFTYSVNVLLCVCESPYAKPRYPLRLWGNGRLIGTFNGTTWEVDQELIQRANVREYIGAADQEPDPVYEAAVGTENAPAYRGRLTVMLEGLQLADFGNRPPMFECEVTSNFDVQPCQPASVQTTDTKYPGMHITQYGWSHGRFGAAFDEATGRYFVLTYRRVLEVYRTARNRAPELETALPLGFSADAAKPGGIVFDPENRVLWVVVGYTASRGTTFSDGGPVAARIDVDSLSVRYSVAQLSWNFLSHGGCCGDLPTCCSHLKRTWGSLNPMSSEDGDGRFAGTGASYGAMLRVHPFSGEPKGEVSWGIDGTALIMYRFTRLYNGIFQIYTKRDCPMCWELINHTGVGFNNPSAAGATNEIGDIVYVPWGDDTIDWLGAGNNYQISLDGTTRRIHDSDAYTEVTGGGPLQTGESVYGWATTFAVFSRGRKKVFVVRKNRVGIINLDPLTGNLDTYASGFVELASLNATYPYGGPDWAVWSEDIDALVVGKLGPLGNMTVTVIDPETDEIIAGPCVYPGFSSQLKAVNEIGGGWIVAQIGWSDKIVTFQAPGAAAMGGGVLLSEIVGDVADEVGLTGTDTIELSDVVPGFAVARQAPARSILEPLRKAYFFGGVESGLSYVWRKRGKAAVATIETGELGAHVFQLTQSEPTPAYELEHVEAIESPRELTLGYIDAQANYDRGTQIAARGVGASSAPAVLDLPIVLDTDYAGQVAWTNLAMLHAAKDPIRLNLTHAREGLEPLDAINVPLANGEYVRVEIQQRTSARPLLEVEGVLEDPAIWDAVFPGVDRGQLPRQRDPATLEDTVLEILDLPPLREADNRIVAYFAMSRKRGDAWPGASAYRVDGGVNSALYSTSSEATMGDLLTPLAAWTKGNRWDRENTVQVRLRRGTLSSATELAVLNGANAAAVGNEIIQFADAEHLGDGVWEIGTLLRHRIGTEWAALSEHSIGTRFVLLTAAALRAIEYPLADLNVARTYRAVTSGQAVADGTSTSFTAIGNSVKPLAPVHVRGERDGSENLAVTWIRRARLNAEWRDDVDVPLDEPMEKYGVYVFADATRSAVKRYEEVSTPSWSYSAADQTTDFGSAQATVHLSVYQITTTYNALGHAVEAAV